MPIKIQLRQFHSDSENLQPNDDPRSFLRDVVFQSPFLRREEISAIGTEGDANEGCEWGFGKVKLIADKGTEEGVEEEEGGEDEVDEVGGGELEMSGYPGHGSWGDEG